jgi:aspartate carbamoyltransferase
MDLYDFEAELHEWTESEKVAAFQREGRLKHVIFASQFNRSLLERLRMFADMIRGLSRLEEGSKQLRELLSHKRAMLFFTQPSTRTFLSFMAACQILGLTCNEVRDPSVSSFAKAESLEDGVRMFSSYFDVIIMRDKTPDFAERCAHLMNRLEGENHRNVPIINAGAGKDQHPTQALLDVYTLQRTFDFDYTTRSAGSRWLELQKKYPKLERGLDNKVYAFCGDLGRGRTVRSLADLLTEYKQPTMFFVSPQNSILSLGDDLRAKLVNAGVRLHEFDSLDATFEGKPILEQIDCLYMTRIQREHDRDTGGDSLANIDLSKYRLTEERVSRMKDYAPILHPFPRDSEVGEIPTCIDSDPRAMYFRQARNGMWARAALLVHVFDVTDDLMTLYHGQKLGHSDFDR